MISQCLIIIFVIIFSVQPDIHFVLPVSIYALTGHTCLENVRLIPHLPEKEMIEGVAFQISRYIACFLGLDEFRNTNIIFSCYNVQVTWLSGW